MSMFGLQGKLVQRVGSRVPTLGGAGVAALPEITPPLVAHYDAAAITGVSGDASLSPWLDESGNDYDASEATNPPTYKESILNSKPVVRFDGVNDTLQTGSFSSTLTQPITVMFVGKMLADGDITIDGIDGTNRCVVWVFNDKYAVFAGDTVEEIDRDDDNHVFVVVFNGASTTLRIDGYEDVSNPGTNGLDGLTLGSKWSQDSRWLDGDLAEVALWDGAASTADAQKLETYAANKWGVTLQSNISLYRDVDVNGRSYRRNAIVSTSVDGTEYQAFAFWNHRDFAVIQVRNNTSGSLGEWSTCVLDGTNGTPDVSLSADNDHRIINVALDKDGYIHVFYNTYNETLKYRVSSNPINSFDGSFGNVSSMVGTNEGSVTYGSFFNAPADGTLYFMFRDGNANDGDIYFYQYDESTGWAAAAGTGTGGLLLDASTGADTAYFYSIGFDSTFPTSGKAHFAWHWRNTGNDGNSNRDVAYAAWDGTNWTQADGTSQTVPVTPSNDDVADAVSVSTGLGGQGTVASDDNGNPHIVYLKNDGSGDAQIYHVWHNGSAWQTPAALTSQTTVASTGDPENGEWRAPDLAIDQSDGTAYVLYTLLTKTGVYVISSSDYSSWSEAQASASSAAEWSPTFDPWQWENNGILYLPVQPRADSVHLNYEIVAYTP